jgi:hypothetical protein
MSKLPTCFTIHVSAHVVDSSVLNVHTSWKLRDLTYFPPPPKSIHLSFLDSRNHGLKMGEKTMSYKTLLFKYIVFSSSNSGDMSWDMGFSGKTKRAILLSCEWTGTVSWFIILPRSLRLLALYGLTSSKSLNPLEIHQSKCFCKMKRTNICAFILIYVTSKCVLNSTERSIIKPTKYGHTMHVNYCGCSRYKKVTGGVCLKPLAIKVEVWKL